NKIIKSLPEVPLNAQHIMSIRRLILDQQIILDRPIIKRMFKNEKQLESVFQSATLFLDEETNISTDNFVADNYSLRSKTRIYNLVIGQLQRVNKVYYLPKHIFTYLEKTSFRKFNHAIILARFYASTGKKDELKKLLNLYSPEKRYKLLVNLSMYLFNLKMYKQSIEHAEAAYEIKPQSADVLRALIRGNHAVRNITSRYKTLKEMRAQFPSRVFPGEYALAEQEYKLMKNEWVPKPLATNIEYQADQNTVLFV